MIIIGIQVLWIIFLSTEWPLNSILVSIQFYNVVLNSNRAKKRAISGASTSKNVHISWNCALFHSISKGWHFKMFTHVYTCYPDSQNLKLTHLCWRKKKRSLKMSNSVKKLRKISNLTLKSVHFSDIGHSNVPIWFWKHVLQVYDVSWSWNAKIF